MNFLNYIADMDPVIYIAVCACVVIAIPFILFVGMDWIRNRETDQTRYEDATLERVSRRRLSRERT